MQSTNKKGNDMEMDYLQFFIAEISYITSAPYFWQSIGMTVATSMFVGAILYNGDLTLVGKGVVTILSYSLFLLTIFFARVVEYGKTIGFTNPVLAYAGIYTVILLSIAYIIGMYIGVFVVKRAHMEGKNDHNRNS